MLSKNVFVLMVVICSVFQCVVSTGVLLDVFKNTMQKTRCKLHTIGTKIIQHNHHHGDPCIQQELESENGVSGGHETNEFGSQNGYQVTENLYEDRQNGNANLYEYGTVLKCPASRNADCPQNRACIRYQCLDPCPGTCGLNAECQVLGHVPTCSCITGYIGDAYIACHRNTHQPSIAQPGQSSDSYNGYNGESSTSSYQTTIKNTVSKDTSDADIDDQGNGDHSYVENNPNNKSPADNVLPEISSATTAQPSNINNSIEHAIEDIFGKPKVDIAGDTKNQEGNSETYPVTLDIDVRSGSSRRNITKKTSTKKQYADVPAGGGRNIINVSCPDGKTSTTTGECVESFK